MAGYGTVGCIAALSFNLDAEAQRVKSIDTTGDGRRRADWSGQAWKRLEGNQRSCLVRIHATSPPPASAAASERYYPTRDVMMTLQMTSVMTHITCRRSRVYMLL